MKLSEKRYIWLAHLQVFDYTLWDHLHLLLCRMQAGFVNNFAFVKNLLVSVSSLNRYIEDPIYMQWNPTLQTPLKSGYPL